ncbi:MAG TPA: DUF4350 domain-containing protein, partial [Flavisolibacter sp.]|nr:DUF4350 domain-containing protein [Flavisolibacter sp.]
VPNKPNEPKNYFEASASSMLTYTLAKGVRKGYLPASFLKNAQRAYDGIVKQFIKVEGGQTNLHGTVAVSGLGGKPYRDGSFEYYMSEPVIVNDPKGMGAFIKAAVEIEMVPKQSIGKGKTVLLDNYFNNEWKKDATGKMVRWHYTWDDKSNGGFAMLGDIFEQHGAKTTSLTDAPTKEKLSGASVYIIVDPDTEKETEKPNYIQAAHVDAIADWVKSGGVLLLFANDAGNAELKNFNLLSSRFGIRFNEDNYNLVVNNQFEQGAVTVHPKHAIFTTAQKLFIKEVATIEVDKKTDCTLKKENKIIAAVAKHGRGMVFAIGDPWLYNEYIDGRKLPAAYQNYNAATDLVKWSLQQSKK